MVWNRASWAALGLMLGAVGGAIAQSEWMPPTGNSPAPLVVAGTINASNRAVPISGANPLPVSGSVTSTPSGTQNVAVQNFPASQPVTVGNFPATQQVSVSNLPATQPVSGTVSVSNLPATQAVTTSPARGTATTATVSLGTTAQQVVAAGANRSYFMVQNQSATADVACTTDGTTPAIGSTANPSVLLKPNSLLQASGAAGAFMPVGAVMCIASAASTLLHVRYVQ